MICHPHLPPWQAYTSQFLSLVMFALVVSEDSISKSPRRKAIIDAMLELPGVWRWGMIMRGEGHDHVRGGA